jgi:uncharacterized repeat protein (TIGR01451 family)
MKERTDKRARRLATFGFPLLLLLVFLIAWSAWADEAPPGMNGAPVLYEIQLVDAGDDSLEISLPSGFQYVGLALGSQIGVEPEVSSNGDRLVWSGPFSGAEVLRFWVAPVTPTEAPTSLPATGAGAEAIRIESPTAPPLPQEAVAPAGELAGTVTVTKSVEVKPSFPENLWVTYEVVFTHEGGGTATLDWITDTLPSGFRDVVMAYGSDITDDPGVSDDGRVVTWDASAYPFANTLTLRYHVKAVSAPGEHENSVVAVAGGEQIGPASASLRIDKAFVFLPLIAKGYIPPAPIWQLGKNADTETVTPGDPVTYNVELANEGNLGGTVTAIVDTLPAGFTFDTMLSGPQPSEINEPTITWTGPWNLSPDESMMLSYRVTSGGGGQQVNTARALGYSGQELASASSTVAVGGGLPFVDEFTTESPDWHRFSSFPGLSPWHWDWGGEPGVWGIWAYEWTEPEEYTGFNLLIYDDPGAQGWTDYRIETSVRDSKDEQQRKGLSGVWFRGTYEDSGLDDGKSVSGYYAYMKVNDDQIYLLRTKEPDPGEDPAFFDQEVVASAYAGLTIRRDRWYDLVVEVRGNNIKIWFADSPDPVIEWWDLNPIWSSGTVGLAVYNTTARWDYIRVLPLD